MRFTTLCTLLAGLLAGLTSCTDNRHIISNDKERSVMLSDFESRRQELPKGGLFDIFDTDLADKEKEALQFLYAYMPLADIADHTGDYFLANIRTSFKAQREMPWGASVPEREFRHFVLPVRVNNEDLDNSRMLFYDELKERVRNLSLHDAVLEINHWCHEKVIYTPSDARTSSPLASIKTAHGRCGEESTLAVAALRAMCIPARQVYTPRWAHTDDNHAWVEAWVDGKWYFLGACEPEPVLNLAWFNAPVSRGMMMHTKVFGHYDGPEEKMRSTRVFTEINVTENYAPVAMSDVKIVDTEGKPVEGAVVEFKVYNYGEYYTVSRKESDAEGRTFLSAGMGDMLVWASKEGRFGFSKLSFGKDKAIEIVLDKTPGDDFAQTLDIIPPVERQNAPEVTPEQRAENDARFAEEDSIRNSYVTSFPTEEAARQFARENGINEEEAVKYITASRGNYAEIMEFMKGLDTPEKQAAGLDLLGRIAQKDLRDTPAEVLNDHLAVGGNSLEKEYVINPRIRTELLTAYKSFLCKAMAEDKDFATEEQREAFRQSPVKLANWVKENITLDPYCNIGGSPITPEGVWNCRTADIYSRNIFFVAMARSLGIPSRIDEVTGKIQIMTDKAPIDIDFESSKESIAPTGTLRLTYTPNKIIDDPKYYAHFTISRITPKGRIQLLNYEEGEVDMGGGTTWSKVFRKGARMDAGNYILVTGTRLANGGVLSHIESFTIEEGKTTTKNLNVRMSEDDIQVIGSFNSESKFTNAETGKVQSVLEATGRGYFTVAVLGMGQEPTNHALRDIAAQRESFEKWGRKLVLLFPDEKFYQRYADSEFPDMMPSTVVCGIDADHSIQEQIAKEMKFKNRMVLPMTIIGDTFNRVVFSSQGYTIGLGDQIIGVARKL